MRVHYVKYLTGTDANNHIVRCECGWSFVSTYLATRQRANVHRIMFAHEELRWDNPLRRAVMPHNTSTIARHAAA
jgi:hypothetical protein